MTDLEGLIEPIYTILRMLNRRVRDHSENLNIQVREVDQRVIQEADDIKCQISELQYGTPLIADFCNPK